MMVVIRSSLTRICRTKWLQYVKDSELLQFKNNCHLCGKISVHFDNF